MIRNDFWVVTTAFASNRQPHLFANLELFCARIRAQRVPLLVVELRLGDGMPQVPEAWADRVMRLHSNTVLWHKERMLNLGVASLPSDCDFVAWIDGDILFERDDWAVATRALLHDVAVVQPFETACWLEPGQTSAPADVPFGAGAGHAVRGFAASVAASSNRAWTLAHYDLHGHPGFAWAARREVLSRHGLYDRAIMGMGDVIAAHAFAGGADYLSGRHFSARHRAPRERVAIEQWGSAVAAETGGRIAAVPGRALHLHHPPTSGGVDYLDRQRILYDADFDPFADIASDANGCWRWNSDKPLLHRRVADTFAPESRAVTQ